jgi:hypothetical protein
MTRLKLQAKTTHYVGFEHKYGHTSSRYHISLIKSRLKPFHLHPIHLIKRGSQTACNRKLGYHDSYTLCRGCTLYPRVVISSLAKRLENLLFVIFLHFLWCMAQRSLHAFTKVNPRSFVLICHRFPPVGYHTVPSGPFRNC